MPLFLPMPMADISNPSQQGCSLELQEALNHWLELAKKMQQIAPLPPSIHSFIYEASDTRRKRVDWQRLLEKLAPVSLLLTSLQGSSASFFFFCLSIFWVSWRGKFSGLENVNCGLKSSACMDFSTGSVTCVLWSTWGHSGISEGQKRPCQHHYLLHVCGEHSDLWRSVFLPP